MVLVRRPRSHLVGDGEEAPVSVTYVHLSTVTRRLASCQVEFASRNNLSYTVENDPKVLEKAQYLVPHAEGTQVGWSHMAQRADAKEPAGFMMNKPEQEEKGPEVEPVESGPISRQQAMSDIASILHSKARMPEAQAGVNVDDLNKKRAKVGKLLEQIKDKAVMVEQYKEQFPDLYEAYMVLMESFVALARMLPSDQMQKSLDEIYPFLAKARFRLGQGMHNLPIGTVFDGRIKIIDPETKSPKWRMILSGQVMASDGSVASSLRPEG